VADSFWLEDPVEPLPRPAWSGRADVIIIGGGVTGCSCALTLAGAGVRVRLHEAREIASGASGRNGGFALRGGVMAYDVARGRLGADRAAALWRLTESYLQRLAALAGDAFRPAGSLRLAADEAERQSLRAEYEALLADGFAVDWLPEPPDPLAGRYHGAIVHPGDGALQPARWVRRLGRLAAEAGADVRERSRVGSLAELDAEHVVVATDGSGQGLLPALDAAVTPTRGQVIATEPLGRLLYDRPHYARHGFDYWHQTPDRRLVVGGRRDADLEGETTADEATTDVIQRELEAFASDLAGEPVRVTHRWAGIWGTTADELPLVGPVPGQDGVWAALGYSGHGNVLGFAAGDLVARAIQGERAPELDLLDPGRLLETPSARQRGDFGTSGSSPLS
jgi:glycine/D-amino acid oxidase-like deaminating enzyme